MSNITDEKWFCSELILAVMLYLFSIIVIFLSQSLGLSAEYFVLPGFIVFVLSLFGNKRYCITLFIQGFLWFVSQMISSFFIPFYPKYIFLINFYLIIILVAISVIIYISISNIYVYHKQELKEK